MFFPFSHYSLPKTAYHHQTAEYLSARPPSSRLDFSALVAVYFLPYLAYFSHHY
ncbi:hypothetical protein COI_2066 [Mannheimia haemolytica serotype A2 str. OVINE]|nr:hypothetical protein COI_2066 [Mannheimia haemolytica serotype A2 str. OVINE]